MNRKRNRQWLLAALLAISSTTLTTATAQAQQVAGHFTLPYAVHWGSATLPAGDYTFTAPSSVEPFILRVRGKGAAAMIMAQTRSTVTGDRSSLRVTRVGNQAVVSALQLAPYGLAFSYPNPYRKLARAEARNRLMAFTEIPMNAGQH